MLASITYRRWWTPFFSFIELLNWSEWCANKILFPIIIIIIYNRTLTKILNWRSHLKMSKLFFKWRPRLPVNSADGWTHISILCTAKTYTNVPTLWTHERMAVGSTRGLGGSQRMYLPWNSSFVLSCHRKSWDIICNILIFNRLSVRTTNWTLN